MDPEGPGEGGEAHPRRPAVHPHLGRRRRLRAHPPGHGRRLPEHADQPLLVNQLYDEDYVTTHTNALFLGDADFGFQDGLFSGYDGAKHTYDTTTWGYQLDSRGKPRRATSLDDPNCVFARLKTFVSRYTPEMGERITGIPAAQIQQIAETMAKNRPGPSSTRSG